MLLALVAALWASAQANLAVAAPEHDCRNGVAVTDPDDQPGLAADCAVLLALKSTLAGTAALNGSADLPITRWEGVSLTLISIGLHRRVTRLALSGRNLSGEIPPQLGNLSNLQYLDLSGHRRVGQIPTRLGRLTQLRGCSSKATGSLGRSRPSWED